MAIIQGNAKQGSTRGFYPKLINGSLRFNDDDSAYLSWTPASAGNRKTWTWSGWVKRGNLGTTDAYILFDASTADTNSSLIEFGKSTEGDTALNVVDYQGGERIRLRTNMKFRDPSAWYHIVVAVDTTQATSTDRVKIYVNGEQQTSLAQTTYPAQNHDTLVNATNQHRFGRWWDNRRFFDGYLANVHFIDGQALTASDFGETKNGVWVAKDYAGTFGTNGFYLTFEDDTQVEAFNTVLWRGNGGTQSITGTGFKPDLVWIKQRTGNVNATSHHHLVDSVRGRQYSNWTDTTDAEHTSPADRDLVSFDSDGFTVGTPNWSYTNVATENYVAWCWDAGANNAVTGHSSVTYTGNGGTQTIKGFPFTPDLLWIKQRSGAQGHSVYDVIRGFDKKVLETSSTGAETTETAGVVGIDTNGFKLSGNNTIRGGTNASGGTYVAWAWDAGDSDPVSNTAGSITSTVKASTANGFSIVSWQANNQTVSTVGHGLSQAPDLVIIKNRSSSTNAQWVVGHSGFGFNGQGYLNSTGAFGTNSGSFNNTAPTSTVFTVGTDQTVNLGTNDYIAYCWHDVTGKQKFGSYEGNNTATGPTVNVGFRPGFVMIKNADGTGNWNIFDGSRFPFADNDLFLRANLTAAEVDGSGEGADAYEVEFTSNGFIPKASGASSRSQVNGTGTYIYAAFAGSYSDYITDYNTDGSIDSRVKASDTTGFSIVSYEGNTGVATVGHGLSATPDFVIVKDRTNSVAFPQWWTWHSSLGTDSHLFLNLTDGGSGTGYFDTSGMSSSTIGFLSDSSGPNTTGESYIAYCWTETTGYSKFGSYTGNGSTTGPTVTTNFSPALVMIKRTDTTGNWILIDNTRTTDTSGNDNTLFANLSDVEATGDNRIQFTDTAFQLVTTAGNYNASGGTYIYAAFADTREAAFWLDQSGNDNDWQPVNLDHNDTVADSPTNNFATFNPLNKYSGTTLSDGNLTVSHGSSGDGWCTTGVTHGLPRSGKFYVEFTIGAITGSDYIGIGISEQGRSFVTQSGDTARFDWGRVYFGHQGIVGPNNTSVQGTSVAPTYTTGDVISVAWDGDTGKVWWAKNGVWTNSGNPSTGTNPAYSGLTTKDYVLTCEGYNGAKATFNAGQQPFKYDPPA